MCSTILFSLRSEPNFNVLVSLCEATQKQLLLWKRKVAFVQL